MPERDIKIYVRDQNLNYVAQIDFFDDLSWVDRHNFLDSPGGWSLTIDANDNAVDYLRLKGSGIVVLIDDETAFSGYKTKITRQETADDSKYVFAGVDDSGILSTTLAHPQPGSSAPPYNSTAYDTRTGVCSTVLRAYVNANIGPSAVTNRKDPRLTIGTDPAAGATVTGNARWQKLHVLLNELATQSGGVGYKIRQSGSNLEFQTYATNDVTDTVIFSLGNGTFQEYSYESEAGPGNYVFAGGQGEGTARTIREGYDGPSIDRWGRRELFKDQRDVSTTAELDASIVEELANSSDIASVTFQALDIPQQTFWTHYQTGDKVTVVIDDVSFQETILEVSCQLNQDGLTVTPTVGTPNNTNSLKLYDQIAQQNKRIRNLERR